MEYKVARSARSRWPHNHLSVFKEPASLQQLGSVRVELSFEFESSACLHSPANNCSTRHCSHLDANRFVDITSCFSSISQPVECERQRQSIPFEPSPRSPDRSFIHLPSSSPNLAVHRVDRQSNAGERARSSRKLEKSVCNLKECEVGESQR